MAGPADSASLTRTAQRTILWDGAFSRLMDVLTGGVVLAALALHVGADAFTIGLLASLPFLAQVAQLPAVKLLLRFDDRRRVVVIASLLGRVTLLGIAAMLFVDPDRLSPAALVLLMGLMTVFAVVSSAAWNWWMRDVIPREELGRYFGRRAQTTTLVAAAALLVAGVALDRAADVGRLDAGYGFVFLIGGLAGLASVYFLWITPHPRPPPRRPGGAALALVWNVAREARHRRLLVALMLTATTLAVALPFTAVFLLGPLGYGFVAVTLLALVSHLAYVAGLRGWGYLSDRFGNRAVLLICVGLVVVSLAGWGLTWTFAGAALLAFLLALHFLGGFALGGVELTSGNMLLKTAPHDHAPAYLAVMSLARALAAGIATLAAGAAWQAIGMSALAYDARPPGLDGSVRGFHLLAWASVAAGLLSLAALRGVAEPGGAPVPEVARAMRREVRMISSIAGIRAFVHVVSYAVEFLTTKPPRPRPRRASRRPPT